MILLAMPYHDPSGSNHDELNKAMPIFNRIFDGIVAHVSDVTDYKSQGLLMDNIENNDTIVKIESPCKDLINRP